ncbi:hypothetical protein BUALT_Bualt15G0127100 [Buddleja alternifolia]|uniref:Uncharacterized protein n=1 Tax=Buddleja alternifolia TaxID=168488 RepID=A0AAV6WLB3_9LAMI|nr:hypothetical protein BUALT_Bualt15G0127100 [Buddleja alternifolia]
MSTSSKLNLPGNTSSPTLVTKEYADWWAKRWKASLAKSSKVIVKINLKQKEPASERSKDTIKQPSSHNQEVALDEAIPTEGGEIILHFHVQMRITATNGNFKKDQSYAQVKSAYAQRETQESHEKALQFAQQSLNEAEAQENEQAKDIKS